MEHLTAHEIDQLRSAMAERTRALAAQVREALAASDVQHYRDLAGAVTDTADEALASALVDVDTALIDRHVEALRDIEAARIRLQEGTYGICIDCADGVPYERLAAYPTAKRCLRCQERREHVYAHRATPTL